MLQYWVKIKGWYTGDTLSKSLGLIFIIYMDFKNSSWYAKQISICVYQQKQAQHNKISVSREKFIFY